MDSLFETAGDRPPRQRIAGYVSVALEQGIDTALTYAVDASLADLAVGERVRVPLGRGNRLVAGYVIETRLAGAAQPPVFSREAQRSASGADQETERQGDKEKGRLQDSRLKTQDSGLKTHYKFVRGRDKHSLSLPPDLVELAQWIARYYCCPLGMVFATMLPAAVKRGTGTVTRVLVGLPAEEEVQSAKFKVQNPESFSREAQRSALPEAGQDKETRRQGDKEKGEQALPVTPSPCHPLTRSSGRRLTALQQAVLAAARARAEAGHPWTPLRELADLAQAKTASPVQQLIARGLLTSREQETVAGGLDLPAQAQAADAEPLTLSTAQQRTLDHLVEHLPRGFGVHLIHGVTGSGKTEVYLRLIEKILEAQTPFSSAINAESAKEAKNAEKNVNVFSREAPPQAGQDKETRRQGEGEQVQSSKFKVQGSACQSPDRQVAKSPNPGVIVLVPEIALTPQTVARFLDRFAEVAVLHSGLTAAQRHSQWRRIRDGRASIVVGARSAIFAPLANLKLIVVDEEQEHSYKQDQLPRYHARDVAIKRGQLCDIPVVLGSATPSLESYHNATVSPTNHFHLLGMPERAPGMKLPKVELVDLVAERRQRRGFHLLSQRLEHELARLRGERQGDKETRRQGGEETRLAAERSGARETEVQSSDIRHQTSDIRHSGGHSAGQAMLLLNRRGYANYIACSDHGCGYILHCDYCDAAMVYHKVGSLPTGGLVRCHHCSAEQMLPRSCPDCGKRITVFGLGTQKVEEELANKLPHLRTLRMDGDTMRNARDYQESLDRFRRGEIDVLLGTQMIAKGLDFPGVRLVGVISADSSLHMPDFRAAERTFQLIAQVAGRAGRSEHPGKVIVQSFNPNDPAIQFAAAHDYEGFARRELAIRREMGLPPIGRMARLVVRDRNERICTDRAASLAKALAAVNEAQRLEVKLAGPMPCAIARIAEHHRMEIRLLAQPPNAAGRIQQLLAALRHEKLLVADAQTAVDMDPVALL